jgi:hypothetical protein
MALPLPSFVEKRDVTLKSRLRQEMARRVL